MKRIIILIVIGVVLGLGYSLRAQEPRVFNLDEYDYYIYKGQRLTFSGLCNAVIDERKDKFISELANIWHIGR